MFFLFFLFCFFCTTTEALDVPLSSFQEQQTSLQTIFTQVEDKMKAEKNDKEKEKSLKLLAKFKESVELYIKNHINAVYAADLETPGSITGSAMGYTRVCIIKKQIKEDAKQRVLHLHIFFYF